MQPLILRLVRKLSQWLRAVCWLPATSPAAPPATPGGVLASAGLPQPESLVAAMLAHRVAAMPATPGYLHLTTLRVPLQTGKHAELRYTMATKARYGGQTYPASVAVSLYGGGEPKPVLLSPESAEMLVAQFQSLLDRSRAAEEHERACASQDAAMEIIEGLL